MNLSMKDRVAVVTGGSKGIGIAVARRFAESGAKVAILARGATDLKTARETLAKDGHMISARSTCSLTAPVQRAQWHSRASATRPGRRTST